MPDPILTSTPMDSPTPPTHIDPGTPTRETPWTFNEDTRDIEFSNAPVFKVYEADDFPCLEEEERPDADRWYDDQAQTVVLALNSMLHANGDNTPIPDPIDPGTVEELRAEISRLQSLIIDPGDPAWEDARAVLAGELRKHMPFAGTADAIASRRACMIPSHIALNLIGQAARSALDRTTSDMAVRAGWQDIATAPYDTPVRVKVGHMTFEALLRPDVSMTEHGDECDQWQAIHEGEHPLCWSEGACWASNVDEVASREPEGWQPLPAAPASDPTS